MAKASPLSQNSVEALGKLFTVPKLALVPDDTIKHAAFLSHHKGTQARSQGSLWTRQDGSCTVSIIQARDAAGTPSAGRSPSSGRRRSFSGDPSQVMRDLGRSDGFERPPSDADDASFQRPRRASASSMLWRRASAAAVLGALGEPDGFEGRQPSRTASRGRQARRFRLQCPYHHPQKAALLSAYEPQKAAQQVLGQNSDRSKTSEYDSKDAMASPMNSDRSHEEAMAKMSNLQKAGDRLLKYIPKEDFVFST